jgi:hypothetical protein
MYFSTMPNIYYEFTDSDGKPTLKVLKDITTNVRVIRSVLENITVYDFYDIVDGETPEIIATKVYGNPLYHWVIMLANDKFDYREDFPLDYTSLVKRVEDLYGATNVYGTHHYEYIYVNNNDNVYVVNSTQAGSYAVSNFEHEERENEKKRRIKLISKPVLDAVVKQYSQMFE